MGLLFLQSLLSFDEFKWVNSFFFFELNTPNQGCKKSVIFKLINLLLKPRMARTFVLRIYLGNQFGAKREKIISSVEDARQAASDIRYGNGYWKGSFGVAFSQNN